MLWVQCNGILQHCTVQYAVHCTTALHCNMQCILCTAVHYSTPCTEHITSVYCNPTLISVMQ